MKAHSITMLGTGLIGDFYTMTLHGQRSRDRVRVAYSRTAARGTAFGERWDIPEVTTDLAAAIRHPETDVVVVALPNHLHEETVKAVAAAGKAVLVTKPLGRNAAEAKRMLEAVEAAGVFGGYLEDLCYTPRTLKAAASVRAGALGDVTWVRSREAHPGPHSAWFWDGRLTGGGAIIDLGCHCIEIIRTFVGKGNRPVEVMCHTDTLVHPIDDEDNAVAFIRFEIRGDRPVRGELDVPRGHGSPGRGGRHPRHDLAEPLPPDRVRDVHCGRHRGVRRREGRDGGGLAVPGRGRGLRARLRGYVHGHAHGAGRGDGSPRDPLRRVRRELGHGRRVPVREERQVGAPRAVRVAWRDDPQIAKSPETYEGHVVIKREVLPDGREKLILKDEATGDFVDRVVGGA